MKTLFKNAAILCNTDGWQTLRNAFLGVENDRIIYIGSEKPTDKYDLEKDMYDHLLMPGLYNMHSHMGMACLRGLGSGLKLADWLFGEIIPIEDRMTGPDVSASARISLLELIASGVAGVSDMYKNSQSFIEDAINSGLRLNVCSALMSVPEDQLQLFTAEVKRAEDFYKSYHGQGNGRIQIDFAIHAEYTSVPYQVQQYSQKCQELGTRMELHLSETSKEHNECKGRYNKTPARYFYDLGVFDSPTIAAHCVWVEPDDIALLSEKGVTAVHNPSSNMKLGSGFMPVRSLLDGGVRVTLGTDGSASNNNQNMFEELHLASLISCGHNNDPTILSTEELMNIATINGARAQGRMDCGQLAVGMKADIVAIDLDKPHLMPDHDTMSLLIYSAQASDVSMNMVDGNILYENGEFLTMDYEKAKYDLRKSIERLF